MTNDEKKQDEAAQFFCSEGNLQAFYQCQFLLIFVKREKMGGSKMEGSGDVKNVHRAVATTGSAGR